VAVFQITLSSTITLVTALSMSAICTNGKIGTGGTYYMISRSLGVEAGAMIGTITYFSMCVLNSLNIIGAAEGVVHILKSNDIIIFDGDLNDIRLIGVILLCIIGVIPLFGMAWESKTHWIMFVLLVGALFDYAFGTFFDISPAKQLKGLTGWNLTTIQANLWPQYQYGQDFYTVIAVFFPMVTGIFAGSGMSGDLRDPSKAIPRGTIWSILTSSASYILVVIFLGCSYVRYVDVNGNQLLKYEEMCANPKNCPGGLVNDYQSITFTSLYSPLIYVGIFVSAISSSLAVYVAAPRMFQAFSRDRLFPYIEWFGQGHGPNNEPYHGYIITFIISFVFVLVGKFSKLTFAFDSAPNTKRTSALSRTLQAI
jgi:solute carrier family 12 sodium/potassium/chloride transporter 2